MVNTNKESEIMCTQAEVKTVVREAFNEEGGFRDEIRHDIKTEMKLGVLQVLTAFGVTIIVATVSFAVYVSGIRSDVDALQQFTESEERFTSSMGALLEQRIQNNEESLRNVATGEDIKRLEETLIRFDERVRNSGI